MARSRRTSRSRGRCGVAAARRCRGPAAPPSAAQPPADTKTFENAEFRYSVALPAGCRHEEGPGTLDAVCSRRSRPREERGGQRRQRPGAGGRRRDRAGRCRQRRRRPRAALRRDAVQGGAARGRVRRGRQGARSRSTTSSRFSKTARVVYTADVDLPRDQVPAARRAARHGALRDRARAALPADGAGARRRTSRSARKPSTRSSRASACCPEEKQTPMKAAVVVFPGSNCDRDVKVALEKVTGGPVSMVWHADAAVPACRPDRAARRLRLRRLPALRRHGRALAHHARRGGQGQGRHARARHLQRLPGAVARPGCCRAC